MRKLYSVTFYRPLAWCLALIVLQFVAATLNSVSAQTTLNTTTVSGFSNNNGSGLVIFNFQNNNPYSVTITDVEGIVGTAGTATAELWTRVAPLSGNTYSGGVTAGNGWTLAGTSTFTGVANTTTLVTQPILTGISVTIPANTTYAMCIAAYSGTSARLRYHTMISPNIPATTVTADGCSILMGNGSAGTLENTSFGAAALPSNTTATYNNPRAFLGKITFISNSAPCTAPPVAGSSVSDKSSVCSGENFILNLSGNSTGSGQVYQWQKGSSVSGPWTDIGTSSTTPAFTTNQSATTYYRCAVTCSGNTQNSVPVLVAVNPGFPGGTYTINSGAPTGGINFQTFTEAVAALNCGITGPVVFNVAPGSGPYNEQVTIPQIGGTSAVNTVTFNGNLATLSFNSTNTSARAGITLNGADYIIIDSLIIDGSAGTYGWGVFLTNQADYNQVTNCVINVSTTNTTAGNHAPVVISGSSSSATTSGNNGNNNIITRNTLTGGYYGVILYGNSTAGAQNLNNTVSKNIVTDAYGYSVYLAYQSGVLVDSNDITRPTRTSVLSGGAGIYLTTGNIASMISRNRIHNMYDAIPASTSTLYYIYVSSDATAGQENKIINNLIYNSGGNGILYGIYNTSGDYMQVYHNTITLDDPIASSGAVYGIYQTTAATGLTYRNNIVVVSRSGTGIKRCIYFVTTTSTISCNNNVLYMNTASGTNNHLGQFGTTNYTLLSDWQTANSNAYDQQSLSVDPAFANPGSGDFYPNNPLLDNAGVGVGVTTDIVGVVRDPISPVPGAYEIIAAAGIDLGVQQLLLPTIKSCYSSSETVTVTIRNYSASPINFVTNPVTVNASVTGPNATTFAPVVVNTGSLASNATLDVVISNSYNMSAAGIYNFNASTTIASDANANNNAMPATDRTVVALTAGVASSTPQAYCVTGGVPTLTLTGSGGGATIQWQTSSTGLAGSWINAGTNSTTYIPGAAITNTTYYRAYIKCGSNTDTSNVVTVAVNNPQLLSTVPGTRCGPGTVTLTATASAGSIIKWYDMPSGGIALGSGTSFVTPFINSNTTYYAAAGDGGSTTNTGMPAALGTATSGAGTTNFGLVFDVLAPFTLFSVDVYPIAASAGVNGTVTIDVIDGANTVLHTATVNVVGNPAASVVGQTVMLNFNLQPGTNYKLRPGSRSAGITGLLFEPSASAPAGNYGYPYVVPGVLSINTSTLTAAPTNTVRNDLYYYFYNWVISTGCESPRSAVTATVNTAPVFTISQDVTVCNNAITTLSVTSALASFNSYIWSPLAGLFTDAGATIPYTGGSATTVYAKTNTAGLYSYIATANNSTTLCANTDTIKLTVLPPSVNISASPAELCVSGSTTLAIPSSIDYGSSTFQWFSSPNGTTYSPIGGATASSYTTPTISATTYYKIEVKNGAAAVCLQPSIMILVNNPQVTGTTAASRCGPGSLTLQATGSTGTTLNWYGAASGGTALGTGNTFVTPVLNNTTTYYVGAGQGGGGTQTVGAPNLAIGASAAVASYYMNFTVLSPMTIQSVNTYFSGTIGASFLLNIRDAATSNSVFTYPGTISVTGTATPQVLPINATLSPGNYQIGWTTNPGSYRNSTGGAYPYTIPGVISITGNTFNDPAFYYYFYQWVVSTGCESPRTAVDATINVNTAVTVQPTNQTACVGGNATFNVTAVGGGLTYQWRKGGNNINGATSSSYTITGVVAGDVGSYDVVVTGSCGTATSTAATLSLNPATSITTQPTAQSACLGGNVTFNVVATGTGTLTYQWRKGGNNISGATSSSYTITGIAAGDVASYSVVVTGDCGPVTSASVPLTINAATAITAQPTAQFGCIGGNVTFSVTATGTGTLTYQWRKAGNNINGATSSTYTLTNLTAGDAANYDVVVTGTCGSVTSASVSLTINPVTTITAQPVSQSVCVGSNVTFSVTATGVNLTYQWRKAGNNISGATSSSYTITGLVAGDAGNYDVVVTGICAAVNSSTVALTVNANGTWLGTINNNWNNSGNWCGGIPTSTTDVIIPSTAPNMPNLSAANGAARNISIGNGATLTIGAGGILDLYANISGTGTFNAAAGSITFRGVTAQTVPAFTATNVAMNGTGGVTPGGNTIITGVLTLINGNITLGSNNLTLNNTSTGSAASHIITNGTGNVVVANLAASQARTIPVGADATSYNPATLAANAAHVTDNFTVRVQQGVFENGLSGITYTTHVANRMWIINEATAGSSNVNITLQWTGAQELTSFNRTKCYVMQHNGTAWSQGTPTAATGTDPYAQTKQNVTTFSPFAIETQRIPRPVTGIYPNPTADYLNVVTDLLSTGPVVFKVYDAKGREVYRRQETLTVGLNQTTLNLTGLSAGVYIVRVSTRLNEDFLVQRFLKVN